MIRQINPTEPGTIGKQAPLTGGIAPSVDLQTQLARAILNKFMKRGTGQPVGAVTGSRVPKRRERLMKEGQTLRSVAPDTRGATQPSSILPKTPFSNRIPVSQLKQRTAPKGNSVKQRLSEAMKAQVIGRILGL